MPKCPIAGDATALKSLPCLGFALRKQPLSRDVLTTSLHDDFITLGCRKAHSVRGGASGSRVGIIEVWSKMVRVRFADKRLWLEQKQSW